MFSFSPLKTFSCLFVFFSALLIFTHLVTCDVVTAQVQELQVMQL